MRVLFTIWGIVAFTVASFACDVSSSDFPEFVKSPPEIPSFDGEFCSLSDWQSHHRKLARFGREIKKFDDYRVEHDRLVRKFDLKLQLALLRDECSEREAENLFDLILTANTLNAGERKEVWYPLQVQLSSELRISGANIDRLNVDLSARCD